MRTPMPHTRAASRFTTTLHAATLIAATLFAATLLTGTLSGCGDSHTMETTMQQTEAADHADVSFLPREVTIDGRTYPYAIYVPADYSPNSSRAWPAIIFLNGMGERGDDGLKQTTVGIGPAIMARPHRFPCIVIMPQLPPNQVWHEDASVKLVLACLDTTKAEYRIDPKRVALTGLSLGGFGTWHMGALHPDRFCALGPICGGGEPDRARELAKTPIWAIHGSADPVVPADKSREMVAAVRLAGGTVRYTEIPNMGHNAWDAAYQDAEFINWLLHPR